MNVNKLMIIKGNDYEDNEYGEDKNKAKAIKDSKVNNLCAK